MTRNMLSAKALELFRGGMSYEEIADELSEYYTGSRPEPTRGWVAGMIRDAKKHSAPEFANEGKDERTGIPTLYRENDTQELTNDPDFRGADHKRALMQRYLGSTWEARHLYVSRPVKTRVVVGVGDLHGQPDETVTAAIIEAEPHIIVVGGDTTDQQYASRHPAESKEDVLHNARANQQDELATMRAWFETLQDNTSAELHVLLGNHDQWSLKFAAQAVPAWMLEHWPEPLDLLLEGFDPNRVKRAAVQITYEHANGSRVDVDKRNGFIYVLGDVLFSHMNKTQSMTESGVSKVFRQWFVNWDRVLSLQHIRVIVHFHVHARTLVTRKGGHLVLVEPGMGGSVAAERYKFDYQAKWGPSVQGLVRLTQYFEDDQWLTDLDSVELVAPRLRMRKG